MIQSKVFYAVKCDCCGDLYEGEDYSYYPTSGDVEDYALDGDWIRHEGGHVCPDCYEIGDEDEIELLKPFIKPEIERPKTDLQRFKDLCNDFGLKTTDLGIADERFVSLWDNNFETRFVFDANGAFVNDFNTQYNFETSKTDLQRFKDLFDSVGIPLEKDESINSFFVDQESSGDTVKTRSGAYARIDFDKDDKFEVFNVFDY